MKTKKLTSELVKEMESLKLYHDEFEKELKVKELEVQELKKHLREIRHKINGIKGSIKSREVQNKRREHLTQYNHLAPKE